MIDMTQTIGQLLNWDFETSDRLEIRDKNNNLIYFENSNGYWSKFEYDSQNRETYWETSRGYWAKWEYDSQGNEIYYESSSKT